MGFAAAASAAAVIDMLGGLRKTITRVLCWVSANSLWIVLCSAAMFLVTLLAVPFFVLTLPTDYFKKQKIYAKPAWIPYPLHLCYLVGKNMLGIVLIFLGVAMLILPGQGILTILLGIVLVDLPGERLLMLFVLKHTKALQVMNWLRSKKGVPPFELPG